MNGEKAARGKKKCTVKNEWRKASGEGEKRKITRKWASS